ncbi:MAG: PPK2 family polyphosphate kinase [Candidatus Dormibacteria bacterium]|jgi:PPK2 family polyphosphate:nucleotide phosphotransferase
MKLDKAVIEELAVRPGGRASLDRRSTRGITAGWLGADKGTRKEVAAKDLQSFVDELTASQALLWASGSYALLVVLQAMDAAGKDGVIKHVMSGVNPQGCQVEAFKQPSVEEAAHDFLWRCSKALPQRGRIGIFNRSYYEEVLVVRVHPELLAHGRAVPGAAPAEVVWRHRYEDINAFEHHLHREGTRIVKVFLHASREEQKKRFLERLADPAKYWKFSAGDLAERGRWDEYQAAYEEALSATSTAWAPWYVVPADHKYALRALVGGLVVHAIDEMGLRPPQVSAEELEALTKARGELLAE